MPLSAKHSGSSSEAPWENGAWDDLLSQRQFALTGEHKRQLLLRAISVEVEFQRAQCLPFRRYWDRRIGPNPVASLEQLPYLPALAFKEACDLLCPSRGEHKRLSSSSTSGRPSVVSLDATTVKRQARAMTSVLANFVGGWRRPMLLVDTEPRSRGSADADMHARSAAVQGFLHLASSAAYLLEPGPNGDLRLDPAKLANETADLAPANPVCVFGFTYLLFLHLLKPGAIPNGQTFALPAGSKVIHIGGWKRLQGESVDRSEFNASLARRFGLAPEDVIDIYGFTEQMGVIYPDCPAGFKHPPNFAEVIVRRQDTLEPCRAGEPGLLQFLTPLPHSYPGQSILTEDLGVIAEGDCDCGRRGTRFRVLGRAPRAEIRGCGDVMAGRVVQPLASTDPTPPSTAPRSILLDGAAPGARSGTADPFTLTELTKLLARLRQRQAWLADVPTDALAALVSAAAERWTADSEFARFRRDGLGFLAIWCRQSSLKLMLDRSLQVGRASLDGFVPWRQGSNAQLLRAHPRGLAVHWLAGNAPGLGMLSLVQSVLAKNANVLKVSSQAPEIVPALLGAFRGLEIETPGGYRLGGDDLLSTVLVISLDRRDREAAAQLSHEADVRIAWGGREAVETILALPRRHDAEDLIFGPRLSYMVIGRSFLASRDSARKLARLAASDLSAFDQTACASPHTVFVERGGQVSPEEFAEVLAAAMADAASRIPPGPAVAAEVLSTRLRQEFLGRVWTPSGTEWTVCYDEERGLAPPRYYRTAFVRPVDDAAEAAAFATPDIQTVGVALAGSQYLDFCECATRLGAARCPQIGRMTWFDVPWDGMWAMSRLVRWASCGGPVG